MSSSPIAQLAEIRRVTGRVIQLKPFDTVEQVQFTPDRVTVLVDTHKLRQTRTGWDLIGHGKRLISFVCQLDGSWKQADTVVIWDETYKARRVREYGSGLSPEDFAEKREWEDSAYRCGNERWPLDSPARQAQGYDYFRSESDNYEI